ncbi:hypothetical protein L7F22_001238 [Adiantum nelumboides]|nr:hypothetical protein [Adiantum nelumboides]
MNALKEEVDKLVNAGFIVPVDNVKWVSLVVVTPKKDGRWRFYIDYKPLNTMTKKDPYPLPFIDQLLDAVVGFERYSVCDGYSGYFQLILAPEDQKKMTFITPWGCFCFLCLPFGLTNGHGAFERKVDWVLTPFLGKFVKGFIDDFCVYNSWKEHVQKLEMTFARYDECEGQLNPKKCHSAQPRLKLHGHVILENGIEIDPEKVEALLLLSSPKDTRQLATFIQKVKYLSRFISLASHLLYPLQQAVKNGPLEWTQGCEDIFDKVKENLSTLTIMQDPNWEKEFYVNPSVGDDAIGAMLLQRKKESQYMKPVHYASRVKTLHERDYSKIELVIQHVLCLQRRFRHYLLQKSFNFLTSYSSSVVQ